MIPITLYIYLLLAREYNDRKYASDLQYTVGTICQVYMEGHYYNAEIISSDNYPKIQVQVLYCVYNVVVFNVTRVYM